MPKRRREVYSAVPGDVSDLLAVLGDVGRRYPDARWDIADGRLIVTSTKPAESAAGSGQAAHGD